MTRSAATADRFDGYVHADAGRLVDGQGRRLIMRGVGLGNWLLPEGYMWGFTGGPQSPRQIETLITDLVGDERAQRFWVDFQDSFVTEADIARIAADGFDHVRLPINSRMVMDDAGQILARGIALIDRTIEWCRGHGLWVVLDLHGAPGGQTGTNIDDSPRGRPELFEDDTYRTQTIALWRVLAEIYAGETVVAGYDLLNEPLPNEWQDIYPDRLVDLYRELTAAIREVDPDHLIIYEGTHWSTNWSIFTETWDPNSMLQFHKYWSAPDLPSIAGYLDVGRRLGLPIYMGEGGENNTDWLQTAFQLYEDQSISWNFWPWKKMATLTSPCSVRPPEGWDAIVAAGAGTAAAPSADDAWATLTALIDAMQIEECDYRPEIVNALMRRAPLRLPSSGFTFCGPGKSYSAHHGVPLRGFRSDDAVTLRVADEAEPDELPFHHTTGTPRSDREEFSVLLEPGDWVAYEINTTTEVRHDVRLLASSVGEPGLWVDGVRIAVIADDETGSWTGQGVRMDVGGHEVRIAAEATSLTLRGLIVR
ncbi:endoglucanase (plasmid) [Cellulomonas sp. WB94]|uniref:cellulase family glycosylhydrolase n=1 Tax=Cellulomonas sp. WB94 TaxID=2173174 RepID=UPI000D569820|nr:cellulase family glycosylhydrolase [Cellulomonas sp. WB94]PVU84387.1 endoglucanase [Cellulomonas sp. WB94]